MTARRNYGRFIIIGLSLTGASSLAAATKAKPAPAQAAAPAGGSGSLGQQIEALATSSRVGAMQVGVRVELINGEHSTLIYEQKADQPFKPASNQKIVTSSAGLTLLPADFTYHTILGPRGQDLIIIGAGDPATGDPRMAKLAKQTVTTVFHEWAEALKAKGVTKVAGNLLFDDSVFEKPDMNASWPNQFNLQQDYCAPASGLNLNDNCVEVIVKPAAKIGDAPEASLFPPNTYMRLQNTAKTASIDKPIIRRSNNPTLVLLSGSIARANDPENAESIAVADPGMFFASACETALTAEGIEITGEIKRERVRAADLSVPADVETLAVHDQKLADLMWRIDKSSLNVFAEGLLKTLGAYDSQGRLVAVGGYDTGRAAIKKYLDKLGVKPNTYVIEDGSGLSHGNRVTPNELVAILKFMNASPRREDWWANLAEPGETGTLRSRLKGFKGKVFAKTGSISGVSALSGYVKAADDHIYVFSVLCNDTHKSKGMDPHALQDELCRLLASH